MLNKPYKIKPFASRRTANQIHACTCVAESMDLVCGYTLPCSTHIGIILVVQNMANSTKRLHRGWNLWCRYISKMKLSEMSADQKATELKRQKALMKRMFSHMVYREISASFRM